MTKFQLHIVSFDIPFPPSYGGIIPIFYRIKALKDLGVDITLHCFYKGNKGYTASLEKMCKKVYYYPRKTTIWQQLSYKPYGITSRSDELLLAHLLQDDAPIFFEGLVSCALMSHPALRKREKFFRECNVEHDYYHALGRATKSWWRKIYLHIEAERLRWFEHTILNAKAIFTLAHQDERHFRLKYPSVQTIYFPCFHGHTEIIPPTDISHPYILYHGNLSVAENHKAAMYILQHFAPSIPHSIIIAGNHPNNELKKEANKYTNVTLIESPEEATMQTLLRNAHIHLLITFQSTGIKLKLLNVLFTEGHVVVNPAMIEGTELAELCHIGNDDKQLILLCNSLFERPFNKQERDKRLQQLNETYNDAKSAQIIFKTIYNQ